ncbi:MAG: CARDB domain-containing protein [Nitrospiraceae bacterium]
MATVTSLTGGGEPLAGVTVRIEIIDGSNSPDRKDGLTDELGRFHFTYLGDGGKGTDTIIACILDKDEDGCRNGGTEAEPRIVSAEATISWVIQRLTGADLTLRVLNQTLILEDDRVTLEIVAAVDNIGDDPAPGTVVLAEVQETGEAGEEVVRPLDIGEGDEVTIRLEIIPPEPNRRYRVTVAVDPTGIIEEAREDNNSYEVQFELDGGDGQKPRLPDLTLRVLNQRLVEGDDRLTLEIVAAVDNIGAAPAPGTIVLAEVRETGEAAEEVVRPLGIGEGDEVTIRLEISSPDPNRRYRVTVAVDPMDIIEEATDDNNSTEVQIKLEDGGGIPWVGILIGAGLVAVPGGAFTIQRLRKEGQKRAKDEKDEEQKKKSPESDYIANQNTREIHKAGCPLVTKIKDENKAPCSGLGKVADLIRDSGYNGCYYCLPRYDTDAHSRQQVLANLEKDRPRR